MEDRKYIIGPEPCWLGYQWEHNKIRIVFEGYEPVNEDNEIYLKFNGRTPYLIPLVDMMLDVSNPLTEHPGVFEAQIEERAADHSLVSQSQVFAMVIQKSIVAEEEYEMVDPRLDTLYSRYRELYLKLSVLDEKFSQVDDSLSESSHNPVENKVLTEAINADRAMFNGMKSDVDYCKARIDLYNPDGTVNVDTALSGTSTNPVQNKVVKAALDSKVEKEAGKGLSSNDYTAADKAKLEGINAERSNNAVQSITLNGLKYTGNNINLGKAVDELSRARIAILESVTYKTINGQSIVGSGDISLTVWHMGDAAPTSDIGDDGDLYFRV